MPGTLSVQRSRLLPTSMLGLVHAGRFPPSMLRLVHARRTRLVPAYIADEGRSFGNSSPRYQGCGLCVSLAEALRQIKDKRLHRIQTKALSGNGISFV